MSKTRLLLALSGAALFISLFLPTLRWMSERFNAYDSFYSHGWLIPVASAWLIWQRRDRLQAAALSSSLAGLVLLVPAVVLHIAATYLHVGFVSGFAMVAAVWGMVWCAWGWNALRTLRFPLLFLLFMVPLPGILLIAASFKMKLWAASAATKLLPLMGIAAQQMGSTIQIPGLTVIVDDTCSGLRSLISLIALSILWASMLPKQARRWQRWTIVLASIPIALGANIVRILALVLIAAIYGAEAADGFIHYGSGIVVFGVAILLLAWLSGRLLAKDTR